MVKTPQTLDDQLGQAYRRGYAAGNAKKNYSRLKNKDDVENILSQFRTEFYSALDSTKKELILIIHASHAKVSASLPGSESEQLPT